MGVDVVHRNIPCSWNWYGGLGMIPHGMQVCAMLYAGLLLQEVGKASTPAAAAAGWQNCRQLSLFLVEHSSGQLLLQGVLPNMIKLAPAAGISWYMFEEVKRFLGVDPRS